MAVVTPVVLNLYGVTATAGIPNGNVLIGQGITSSLDTGNNQQTAWTWTISGDPFAGFVLGPGNTTGHAVELAPAALTQATVPYFYRSIGATGAQPPAGPRSQAQTVTCTATITNLNANLPPVQVTISKTVNVYQPGHTFLPDVGHIAISPGNVAIGAFGDGISPRGVDWKGTVTTPALLIQEGGPGSWNYTQLIKSGRTYTLNGTVHNYSFFGVEGLDGGFPYDGPYPSDGTLGHSGDSPSLPLNTDYSKIVLLVTGRTWMLYLPPSYDSNAPTTFVPLHRYEWTAFGYATYDAVNGWQAFVTGNGIAGSDKGPTSVLPDWTLIVTP